MRTHASVEFAQTFYNPQEQTNIAVDRGSELTTNWDSSNNNFHVNPN